MEIAFYAGSFDPFTIGNISSSMVMELYENGKDVSKYLPEEVMELVKKG